MSKLIDKFNETFNNIISIEGGKEPLNEKDQETDIDLSYNGKTITVTKKSGTWHKWIYITYNKNLVNVTSPKGCVLVPYLGYKQYIRPYNNSFSFDLSVGKKSKVPMNEIGATVTVGDEGDVDGKKRQRGRP